MTELNQTPADLLCPPVHRRTALGLIAASVVSSCASGPAEEIEGAGLQIKRIEVIFPETAKREPTVLWRRHGYRIFPDASVGLSRSKVAKDFSNDARAFVIPRSRGGVRPVNVSIELYSMRLRGEKLRSDYFNMTSLEAVMDIMDAEDGSLVLANEWIYVWELYGNRYQENKAMIGQDGNYVQAYVLLRRLFVEQVARRLDLLA